MTRSQRRLLLLVAIELVSAPLVLWWFLKAGRETAQLAPSVVPSAATDAAETREPQPLGIWIVADLPPPLATAIGEWVDRRPDVVSQTEAPPADLVISWQPQEGAEPLAELVLVPVARFPSLREGIGAEELRRLWQSEQDAGDGIAHLYVSPTTTGAVDAVLGPRSQATAPSTVAAAELVDHLWAEPAALALIPFDQLEPRLKPLPVDGLSALDQNLELRDYPLVATLWASGPRELVSDLAAKLRATELNSNRRLERLTVVAMTGVTALTRGIAYQIEARGDPAWPAHHVAELLASADLTHISNEVSFQPGCEVDLDTWVFCARPEYLETLRLVGADLVELTGNHNLDFGPYYAALSLDLYAEAGMQVFGGGRNATEARQPLLITHDGNSLAFLGYNQFGPDYAWATDEEPGAARFSPEAVRSDLAQIRPQADLAIVTIQHTETYDAIPLPEQVDDFRAAVEAGADLVIGSQAHQPQAIEFYTGKPIFYGLGNLFFDQTWSEPTRQGLIVRLFVYEGRLIAVEMIPSVIDDAFQARLAEGDEADDILQTVFAASGW